MTQFTVTLVFGQATPIPNKALSALTVVTTNVPDGAVVICVQGAKVADPIVAAEQPIEKKKTFKELHEFIKYMAQMKTFLTSESHWRS